MCYDWVLVAHVTLDTELQLGSELPLLACDRLAGRAGMLQARLKEILSVTASIAEVLGLYHLINVTLNTVVTRFGNLGLYNKARINVVTVKPAASETGLVLSGEMLVVLVLLNNS